MPEFSTGIWLLLGIATMGGILSLLNFLASTVRNEQYVYDLRVEVHELKSHYNRRMREIRELEAQGLKNVGGVAGKKAA
jgi:hypothetical protein